MGMKIGSWDPNGDEVDSFVLCLKSRLDIVNVCKFKSLISLEEWKKTDNVGLVLREYNVGKEHWWNDTNTGKLS